MAQLSPPSSVLKANQSRRELFPCYDDDDSDELGHISPLNSLAGSPARSFSKSDEEDFNASTISDYVILESLCNTKQEEKLDQPVLNCDMESPQSLSLWTETELLFRIADDDTPLKKSPIISLKTPQSTSATNLDVPKLVRKSPSQICTVELGKRKMLFNDSPTAIKQPKLDHGSKVRTALFSGAESLTLSNKQAFNTGRKTRGNISRRTNVYLCHRKRNKWRFGQINAGVHHRIRKPKKKKLSNADLIKEALRIMDSSSLNDYLNSLNNKLTQENSPVVVPQNAKTNVDVHVQEAKTSNKRELSPSPDPTKKFFKFKRHNAATVTLDKHMKLEMNDGKFSIIENKRPKVSHLKFKLDFTDFNVPENNLISTQQIDNILDSLDEDKENAIGTNQVVLEAHNSVIKSENAVHLHTSPSTDSTNTVLLSPTSQMCNMTSDLMLSSPKRTKQNVFQNNFNELQNQENPQNEDLENLNQIYSTSDMEQEKLFPIFCGPTKLPPPKAAPKACKVKKLKPLAKDQLLLDAGQKRFGATQCAECKLVYHMGDANDELKHIKYHNAEHIFHFNGWKDEHVKARFVDARIIRVLPTDAKAWLKKVHDLLEIINRELGYFDMQTNLDNSQVYLYIKNKSIAGCLIAEPKTTAYRLLNDSTGIDLCSEDSVPIKCGVNRLWVAKSCRRQGIGTALMSCLRSNFMYGGVLHKNDIAMSSPTEEGKVFARKYFETANFLIYTY